MDLHVWRASYNAGLQKIRGATTELQGSEAKIHSATSSFTWQDTHTPTFFLVCRVSGILRCYTAADAPFALQNAAVLSLHRMAAARKPLEEALAADGTTLHPALRFDPPLQWPPLVACHRVTGSLPQHPLSTHCISECCTGACYWLSTVQCPLQQLSLPLWKQQLLNSHHPAYWLAC